MVKVTLLTGLGLLFLAAAGNSFAGEGQTNVPPQPLVHNWDYISFGKTLLPAERGRPVFMVSHWINSDLPSPGLRVSILNLRQGFEFFKTNPIAATLYRANGEMVAPTADGKESLQGFGGGGSGGPGPRPMQTSTCFPPGSNTLEECWIEVSINPERYWLEIPCGFDRDSSEPLAPSLPAGDPKFVPAMKSLTEHDHVMRWQNVHYDLGHTRDGSRLTLIQSNPFDAESQVEVYGGLDVRMKVSSPPPTVRIVDNRGVVLNGTDFDIHLNDDSNGRTDTYRYNRYPNELRSWGHIDISVNGESRRVVVPSSLYKYTQGHAATPAPIAFLADLRVGMTLGEANLASRNCIADGIRNHPLASDPHQYHYVFPQDQGEVTLQFDDADNLVRWGEKEMGPR